MSTVEPLLAASDRIRRGCEHSALPYPTVRPRAPSGCADCGSATRRAAGTASRFCKFKHLLPERARLNLQQRAQPRAIPLPPGMTNAVD
jgi:hypothetical protein